MKSMEFTIEKKVVRVPTAFVLLNGERYDRNEFYQIVEIFHRFAKGPLERRDLNLTRDFIVHWEKQGVLTSYNDFHTDDYGERHTYEMLKKGPAYTQFFVAFQTFETKLQLERNQADLAQRRKDIKQQLKDLDRPATKRSRSLKSVPGLEDL